MNTEIKNTIQMTEKEAQYDASAKRLLGQKRILAHILVKTVEEFHGMNPGDVVQYIEGTPYVGVVPIEPGLTNLAENANNAKGQRIVGLNTESAEVNEGLIRFDIVFYVRMKDGLSQIIVNIEAQRAEPVNYEILNRAVFYGCRLISSQKERDFVNSNYDDIKRVYSIWICMNTKEHSMNHIHLANEAVIGSYEWKGRLDLLNIVMIGLAEKLPEKSEPYELHRLLGTLLSDELSAEDKLEIVEQEYEIPLEEELRRDVSIMCNLSQGIKEKAMENGRKIGEEIGESRGKTIGKIQGEMEIIQKMHKNGFTSEQIANITDKDVEEVEEMLAGSGGI